MNTTVCFGCNGTILVVKIFRYSFVCLRCVVPVSMHYRLCLVTVRVKVLQNRRLSDFQRGQFVCASVAGACVTKTVTLLGVSRGAVAVVDGIRKSWEDVII